MNLNDLTAKYQKDAKLDSLNLEEEVKRAALLHAEYVGYWSEARRELFRVTKEYQKFKLEKTDFYETGPSKETQEKGWKYPVSGKILKMKIPTYLDADKELQELEEKVNEAQIKVDVLDKIVQMFSFRRNSVDSILHIRKWEGGG